MAVPLAIRAEIYLGNFWFKTSQIMHSHVENMLNCQLTRNRNKVPYNNSTSVLCMYVCVCMFF